VFNLAKLQGYLTTVMLAAGVGLARGDALPVIIISSLFGAAHSGADTENRTPQRH
jgi:hypothetical protein